MIALVVTDSVSPWSVFSVRHVGFPCNQDLSARSDLLLDDIGRVERTARCLLHQPRNLRVQLLLLRRRYLQVADRFRRNRLTVFVHSIFCVVSWVFWIPASDRSFSVPVTSSPLDVLSAIWLWKELILIVAFFAFFIGLWLILVVEGEFRIDLCCDLSCFAAEVEAARQAPNRT